MKIFTIGTDSHECFGHGDFGTVTEIQPMGAYGTGSFPPCFTSKDMATEWLYNNGKAFYQNTRVVELELIE